MFVGCCIQCTEMTRTRVSSGWDFYKESVLHNAIKYSPEKATVSISIKYNKIKVCNSNTVVEEDKLKHLGQRFYRPAGQKTTGSGLGVSIIMKIAALYRCRVAFANTDEGFCVSILPLKD